jgi:thioredoxin reductase
MQPSLSTSRFDVIIIGAGINGAGIARDAAMRGLKVLCSIKAISGVEPVVRQHDLFMVAFAISNTPSLASCVNHFASARTL